MIYVAWSEQDIHGLNRDGIVTLWTEIDEQGVVRREIGFDGLGRVVHVSPTPTKRFGYFDNQVVDIDGMAGSISSGDFVRSWEIAPVNLVQRDQGGMAHS